MTLQELLGIEHPIIQAPMAGVQGSALAIAVSNAGGLGSLPCAMLTVDAMRPELALIRAQTARPFNVNFFCHRPPEASGEREQRWRAALSPYFAELGVDPNTIATGVGRASFDSGTAPRARRVQTGRGELSLRPAIRRAARARARRAVQGSCRRQRRSTRRCWLEAQGVDAVIAQGLEAGGHRGHFLSHDLSEADEYLALVTQVVRAVKIPVIAAGGIADAKGVAAAMAIGAAGAQIGTAYLLCPEATTSAVHRAALKSDAARFTALTNVFTGRPARGIVNRIIRELGPISDAAPEFPLATSAMLPLRARPRDLGSGDFSPLWAGQNTSGCKEVPAAVLTQELARDLYSPNHARKQ